MSSEEVWLLVHSVSAAAWAGGAFAIAIIAISAQRTATPVPFAALAPINAWIGPHVFIPAAVLALASGLLLVIDGPWSFDQLWVVLGLIGFAVTFLPGVVFLSPEGGRIREAIAREGPGSPEVARRIRRVLLVSRAVTLLLLFILADMTLKPTADDGWMLAIGGALFAALLAGIVVLGRKPPVTPPSVPAGGQNP